MGETTRTPDRRAREFMRQAARLQPLGSLAAMQCLQSEYYGDHRRQQSRAPTAPSAVEGYPNGERTRGEGSRDDTGTGGRPTSDHDHERRHVAQPLDFDWWLAEEVAAQFADAAAEAIRLDSEAHRQSTHDNAGANDRQAKRTSSPRVRFEDLVRQFFSQLIFQLNELREVVRMRAWMSLPGEFALMGPIHEFLRNQLCARAICGEGAADAQSAVCEDGTLRPLTLLEYAASIDLIEPVAAEHHALVRDLFWAYFVAFAGRWFTDRTRALDWTTTMVEKTAWIPASVIYSGAYARIEDIEALVDKQGPMAWAENARHTMAPWLLQWALRLAGTDAKTFFTGLGLRWPKD